MSNICINTLTIKGTKQNIINFLNNFHSEEHGFKMNSFISNQNEELENFHEKYTKDIFESSSYKQVISSYIEDRNIGKVQLSYLTYEKANIDFIKTVSCIYKTLEFEIKYFEQISLVAGKSIFHSGVLLPNSIEYHKNNNDKNSIIDVYKFAINNSLITTEELMNLLEKHPSSIKNHFFDNTLDDDCILDFNNIKEEYMTKNIAIPKGDE